MGFFSPHTDDLTVSASFPESNPFGLVVNGEKNDLLIHLANTGNKNYTLLSAAASFHDPARHWSLVKNITAQRYNVPLIHGANFSAPYVLHSEFRPQELGLTVWVNVVEHSTESTDQIVALNQTVSVVEQPSSWLDPSLLFLWLIIGTALFGGAYAVYNTFFAPQSKKGKRGVKKTKAVVVNEKVEAYPTVKPYEEDWIPAHHLKNRASKTKKVDGGLSSGGEEATSGAESGLESKGGKKRRSKKA